MMTKNKDRVIVTNAYLCLPEIESLMRDHKSLGFTIAVLAQLSLSQQKFTIGRTSDLLGFSHRLGIQPKTLKKIMDESAAFVMDYENGIYYMPRLRRKFGFKITPDEEELKQIRR